MSTVRKAGQAADQPGLFVERRIPIWLVDAALLFGGVVLMILLSSCQVEAKVEAKTSVATSSVSKTSSAARTSTRTSTHAASSTRTIAL